MHLTPGLEADTVESSSCQSLQHSGRSGSLLEKTSATDQAVSSSSGMSIHLPHRSGLNTCGGHSLGLGRVGPRHAGQRSSSQRLLETA